MKIFHLDCYIELKTATQYRFEPPHARGAGLELKENFADAAEAAAALQKCGHGSSWQSLEVFATEADLQLFFQHFQQGFTRIEAAGGVVEDGQGRILAIYRLGTWDLPKGKLELGESPEIAAVREVQEETGLSALTLLEVLPYTYHIYPLKAGDWAFKTTHWFRMRGNPDVVLVPQTTEDITQAIWVDKSEIPSGKYQFYASLIDLLAGYLRKYPV